MEGTAIQIRNELAYPLSLFRKSGMCIQEDALGVEA